jgi:hypothetical protein
MTSLFDKFLNVEWAYSRFIRIRKHQCLVGSIFYILKLRRTNPREYDRICMDYSYDWDFDIIKYKRKLYERAKRGPFRQFKSLYLVATSKITGVCNNWLQLPWNIWELILAKLGIEAFRMSEVSHYFNERMQNRPSIIFDITERRNYYQQQIAGGKIPVNYLTRIQRIFGRPLKREHQQVKKSTFKKSGRRSYGGGRSCPKMDKMGGIRRSSWNALCGFLFVWVLSTYHKVITEKTRVRINKPIISGNLYKEFAWKPY